MKRMEVDMVDYAVKPCPFCGKTEFLKITDRRTFEELYDENGCACITISCSECRAEMYEHDVPCRDYHKKVKVLIDKWNGRESK